MTIHIVLSIAGTDPTSGAGVQADLKAFTAIGAYGVTAAAAVVAQNTCGVRSFVPLDPSFVGKQIDAAFDDVRVDAVKIGIVANAANTEVVADRLRQHEAENIVLGNGTKSGDHLLDTDAVAAVRDTLVPLATIITPTSPRLRSSSTPRKPQPGSRCTIRAPGCAASVLPGCYSGRTPHARGVPRRLSAGRREPVHSPPPESRLSTTTEPAAHCRRRSPRCCPVTRRKTVRARPSGIFTMLSSPATSSTSVTATVPCITFTSSVRGNNPCRNHSLRLPSFSGHPS